MWCPIGYVHFHELEEAIETASRRLVPFDPVREYQYLDAEKTELDYENSSEFRRLVVAGIVMELFLYEYRYCACGASLSGQVFRLSPHIVRPVNYNHFMEYKQCFARRLELLYVDISTAKIDVSGVAQRFLDWSENEGYEDVAKAWQSRAFSDFGELDGWIVCYPKDEVDITIERLTGLWDACQPPSQNDFPRQGRPRLQEEAALAYYRVYPKGHGNTPWKEVHRKLNEVGVAVSQKTLQRALGKK